MPIQSRVDARVLKEAVNRRAASSLCRNEAFDDFLIPVFIEENFVRELRGVVVVQLKNLESCTLFCFAE
jgi:hypothetical protein